MSLLQPLLELVHFLQTILYYLLAASCFIGQNIFLLVMYVCIIIRDIFAVIIIIGEDLYYFASELDDSIRAVSQFVQISTNNSVNCFMEAVAFFCHKMMHFFANTLMYSRLLAVEGGVWIINILTVLRGALLLIADCCCWLVTILPHIILQIIIFAADNFAFGVHALGRGILCGVNALINDIRRITIGTVVLYICLRRARFLARTLCYYMYRIVVFLHLMLSQTRRRWRNWKNRIRDANVTVMAPLPHSSQLSHSESIPESQQCVVCRERVKCVLLLPCKHLCLCKECVSIMFDEVNPSCPLCRSNINQSITVYV